MIATVNYHSSVHFFRVNLSRRSVAKTETAAPLQNPSRLQVVNGYLGPDFTAVELPYSPSYFVWSVEEAGA